MRKSYAWQINFNLSRVQCKHGEVLGMGQKTCGYQVNLYLHIQRTELNFYPVGFTEPFILYKQESGMIRFWFENTVCVMMRKTFWVGISGIRQEIMPLTQITHDIVTPHLPLKTCFRSTKVTGRS